MTTELDNHLMILLNQEIPEGRRSLKESHTNLENVAAYCIDNYLQSQDKKRALEETRNYTTQSLASVAYQINTLAYNMLQLLDFQNDQLIEMESSINNISQTVMIHKEKVARREIGVLTTNKTAARQHKILVTANPERHVKYVRRPIDYSALDEIGHSVKVPTMMAGPAGTRGVRRTASSTGGRPDIAGGPMGAVNGNGLTGSQAPTTKPPTPPSMRPGHTGTIGRNSKDYRTPSSVIPTSIPSVPSGYAPNYPIGHPQSHIRKGSDRSSSTSGYGSLHQPQVGMAYPQQRTSNLVNSAPAGQYGSGGIARQHSLQQQQHQQHYRSSTQSRQSQPLYQHSMSYEGNRISHQYAGSLQQQSMGTPPPPPPLQNATSHQPTYDTKLPSGPVSPPLPPPPEMTASGDDTATFGYNYHHGGEGHYGSLQHGAMMYSDRGNSGGLGGGYDIDLPPPEGANIPWQPPEYIEKVVALYDYTKDKDDELTFQENAVIYVIKKNDDGWYEGVVEPGHTGLFPGNYVEPCL